MGGVVGWWLVLLSVGVWSLEQLIYPFRTVLLLRFCLCDFVLRWMFTVMSIVGYYHGYGQM